MKQGFKDFGDILAAILADRGCGLYILMMVLFGFFGWKFWKAFFAVLIPYAVIGFYIDTRRNKL